MQSKEETELNGVQKGTPITRTEVSAVVKQQDSGKRLKVELLLLCIERNQLRRLGHLGCHQDAS